MIADFPDFFERIKTYLNLGTQYQFFDNQIFDTFIPRNAGLSMRRLPTVVKIQNTRQNELVFPDETQKRRSRSKQYLISAPLHRNLQEAWNDLEDLSAHIPLRKIKVHSVA